MHAFKALSEEKQAVLKYGFSHPEIHHREVAWRMIYKDVAHLSASTVYRIPRAAEPMIRQRILPTPLSPSLLTDLKSLTLR